MSKADTFIQSVAVFDEHQRLIDWNEGFAQEFADAGALLSRGVSVREIKAACLLPERSLDLSWAVRGDAPPAIDYINSRRSVTVAQHLSVCGHVFRIAQSTQASPQLHPDMLDESVELLRSTALQISAAVLKRREQENLRLHEMALQDGLTGVANRRYFNEVLEVEWQRCQQSHLPMSMIFIDIDYFKRYNDFYGHVTGDECLKAIATTLMANLSRPGDLVARYGGEEFTCLLPGTDLEEALYKAQTLERAVRALSLTHEKSEIASVVTISQGVTTAREMVGEDASVLIKSADQLLYQAKAAGRGCVRSALCPPGD